MAHSDDWKERRKATNGLRDNFQIYPEKEACEALLALTKDKDNNVRWNATYALRHAFPHVIDKNEAWKSLLTLTKDNDMFVRMDAASALWLNFPHVTDKNQAWNNLLELANEKNKDVQLGTVSILRPTFPYVIDKEQACKTLLKLSKEDDSDVRWCVAYTLSNVFPHVTDKNEASKTLLELTKDKDEDVRRVAVSSFGSVFPHMTDKNEASKTLLELTKDKDENVRRVAVSSFGSVFPHITDKNEASKTLFSLIECKDNNLLRRATSSIGSAFPYLTDKEQACKALLVLTKNKDNNVRSYAYHSLGKISIMIATAATEDNFKKELEKALEYFEKSANEATWDNPAKFCLPFYRSFHAITFKKDESENEVKKSIEEAKKAVGRSNRKEKLLDAIENLSNALTEAQKACSLGEIQGDLTAYSRYCNRASELLGETKEMAPGATGLIRKGLPIIDQQIKDILAEIKKKTGDFCKETKDTSNEDIGTEIHKIGKELSKVRDPIALEKAVENMQMALSIFCKRMPKEEGGEACEILAKAKKEPYVEDKLNLINMIFPILSTEYKIGQKLDELLLSIKPGLSEELVISVGSKLLGTGFEHVIHIPLREISYPELKEDLEKIKGNYKLASYPTKLSSKIKDYLIRNKKDDLLNKLS